MRAVASLAPLSIVFLSLAPSPGAGAVPFSHFEALPATQLGAVQVKLTPLGRRAHPIPSLVLMSPSGVPDLAAFAAGYRPGFVYGPSDSALITCRISVPELRAFLEAAARLPEVIDGDVDSLGVYSFALLDTAGGAPQVLESILDDHGALELLRHSAEALRTNPRAASILASMACGLTVFDGSEGEITRSAGIGFGGFSYDPATRRTRCRVRVVNSSPRGIRGPLVLVVLADPPSVRLVEPDGYTCDVFRPGCPYVVLPVDSLLSSGAAVERPLVFDNPRQSSFSLAARLFSGIRQR